MRLFVAGLVSCVELAVLALAWPLVRWHFWGIVALLTVANGGRKWLAKP